MNQITKLRREEDHAQKSVNIVEVTDKEVEAQKVRRTKSRSLPSSCLSSRECSPMVNSREIQWCVHNDGMKPLDHAILLQMLAGIQKTNATVEDACLALRKAIWWASRHPSTGAMLFYLHGPVPLDSHDLWFSEFESQKVVAYLCVLPYTIASFSCLLWAYLPR